MWPPRRCRRSPPATRPLRGWRTASPPADSTTTAPGPARPSPAAGGESRRARRGTLPALHGGRRSRLARLRCRSRCLPGTELQPSAWTSTVPALYGIPAAAVAVVDLFHLLDLGNRAATFELGSQPVLQH